MGRDRKIISENKESNNRRLVQPREEKVSEEGDHFQVHLVGWCAGKALGLSLCA